VAAPVTNASAEISFSGLKLMKTYLQRIMIQERLLKLAIPLTESGGDLVIKYTETLGELSSRKSTDRYFYE
jgi:hypothetical protein